MLDVGARASAVEIRIALQAVSIATRRAARTRKRSGRPDRLRQFRAKLADHAVYEIALRIWPGCHLYKNLPSKHTLTIVSCQIGKAEFWRLPGHDDGVYDD
jgi:hypothetical protein